MMSIHDRRIRPRCFVKVPKHLKDSRDRRPLSGTDFRKTMSSAAQEGDRHEALFYEMIWALLRKDLGVRLLRARPDINWDCVCLKANATVIVI